MVTEHWATITLSTKHAGDIRDAVTEHMQLVLPGYGADREAANVKLKSLEQESDRLLEARLAGAVTLDQLKREQERIAIQRGAIGKTQSAEELGERRPPWAPTFAVLPSRTPDHVILGY